MAENKNNPLVEEVSENVVEEVAAFDVAPEEQTNAPAPKNNEKLIKWLLGILSFIIFPVGIVLYFAIRKTHEPLADLSGKCAMWGICFIICAGIIGLLGFCTGAIFKTCL